MSRWWRIKHAVKYWDYRPKWVIRRIHEHRLTVKRGYSTFVLDEFDHHFNEMAIASLRYHLSPECVCNNEAHRPAYEALIARLSEPDPQVCTSAHERELMQNLDWPINEHMTDEHQAIFDSFHIREDEWRARRDQARKDFVDIMPGLWS